jgi:hypothetical protein
VKRSYLFPRVGKQDILFQFADELSIDTGSETYMITADSVGIWLSCGPLAEDITHDPVKIVADLIGCSTKELEPMLRQHFAERTGKNSAESLEHVIVNALPGLAALVARVPTLTVPLSMSPRLRRARRFPLLRGEVERCGDAGGERRDTGGHAEGVQADCEQVRH